MTARNHTRNYTTLTDAIKASALRDRVLEVLGQPAASPQPCESPFDHPAPRQNLKTLGGVGSLDDRGRKSGHGFLLTLGEHRSLIAAIGEQFLQERIAPEQRLQDQHATVAVLDISRMNQRVQQKPYRINEDMALLALDLFPRIIPARVNRGPPFSALFTL